MPKTRYAAGITSIESNGAVIMLPTIGAAMRRIISDPVPLPHIMGSRPAMNKYDSSTNRLSLPYRHG